MRTKPIVTFTIDSELIEKLDQESRVTRVSKSRIVNDLIKVHYDKVTS